MTHSEPMGRIKKRSPESHQAVRESLTDHYVCVKLCVGVFQVAMLKRILYIKGQRVQRHKGVRIWLTWKVTNRDAD